MLKFLSVLSLFLSIAPCSYAYEQYYESSESMARGGTEGGYWDQIHSGFNAPHELGLRPDFDLFFKFNGQISSETYSLILDPPEAVEGEYESTFDQYFGKKYFVNGNAVVGFNYQGFMVIPYYKKARSSAQLNYKVYPEAEGYLEEDTGYMLAYGKRFGRLMVGLNYQGFERKYDIYTVDLISGVNNSYEFKTSETLHALSSSVGWILRDQADKKETVFLAFKNFNNPNRQSQYDQYNGDLIPLINLGYQFQYKQWNLEANLLDLNDYYLGFWKNRFRLGAEYKFSEYSLLRSVSAGLLDGSISLGTSVNLFRFINVSLATYEKNIYNFYEKKTRFYSVGLEVSF